MKRQLIAALLVVTSGLGTMRAERNTKIEGTWQMSYVANVDGKSAIRYVPIWKTFTKEGTFSIMMWRSDEIAAYISTNGKYNFVNDSIATEDIFHSATNPKLKGTQTVLKYQFIAPDIVFVRYKLEGSNEEGQELWTRISSVGHSDLYPLDEPGTQHTEGNVVIDTTGIYLSTEVMPEYPNGGHDGLMKYMAENLSYPVEAMERGLEGVALIRFVVNEKGRTENFRIIKSASPLLDQEALRVLKEARFTPGQHNGKKVKVYVTVPVTFKLK